MSSNENSPIISEKTDEHAVEYTKCGISPGYFIDTYVQIKNPKKKGSDWFPFKLWPAQHAAVKHLTEQEKVIILKARQLGLSWLCLAYALWLMIFDPGSVILLFSKTKDDAIELMDRLSGMAERLPDWMDVQIEKSLTQVLELENKSKAKSFTTTKHSGRSFTANLVIIDEAAFIPFLDKLLNAAEETADEGGKVFVISTNDKEKPNNGFADLYRRTKQNKTDYFPLFIPWYGRPTRDAAWYDNKVATKKQDDLWQEYPEVPDQALSGLSSSKRFDPEWIKLSARANEPLSKYGRIGLPAINHVRYYKKPFPGRSYLMTVDTAEGDITSDPSAFAIWDSLLWEEVVFGMAKWEPAVLAGICYRIGSIYNSSVICVERNNHGHAVILSLKDVFNYRNIYKSPFDKKLGWLTNPRTKVLAVDKTAELMESGEFGIRSKEILAQLANLEGLTLAAPEGDHDDAAMTAILAGGALTWTTASKQRAKKRPIPSMTY